MTEDRIESLERHVAERLEAISREIGINRERYHKLAGEVAGINLNIAGQLGEMRVSLARIEENLVRASITGDSHGARIDHLEDEASQVRGAMKTLKIFWIVGFGVLAIIQFWLYGR